MSSELDQEGYFRLSVMGKGLRTMPKSQAACWTLLCQVVAAWNERDKKWDDWRRYDVSCRGSLFILNKSGEVIEGKVREIALATGWSGDLTELTDDGWEVPEFVGKVGAESSEKGDKKYFNIQWIYKGDYDPSGALSNIDLSELQALQNRYAPKLKAIIGASRGAPQRQPKKNGPPKLTPPTQTGHEPFLEVFEDRIPPNGWDEDTAFEAFRQSGLAEKLSDDQIGQAWLSMLRLEFGGTYENMGASEWHRCSTGNPEYWASQA